jgi:glucose-1-phosphate adenylyltransferase
MRGNNVLGIVFSNMKDDTIRELTEMRTMGSVPFGGRYRLIDFPLSNMTHSGISRVGVVTKSNYRSLMDHVGSGKAWGLSRKHTGLVFLPPYGSGNAIYQNRIGALSGIREYLEHNHEEFVFMTDCDTVVNMDIQKVVDAHLGKGADITIVCKHDMLLGLAVCVFNTGQQPQDGLRPVCAAGYHVNPIHIVGHVLYQQFFGVLHPICVDTYKHGINPLAL